MSNSNLELGAATTASVATPETSLGGGSGTESGKERVGVPKSPSPQSASPEEMLEKVTEQVAAETKKISSIQESMKGTMESINKIRALMGLPPEVELPISITASAAGLKTIENKKDKLEEQQDALEAQLTEKNENKKDGEERIAEKGNENKLNISEGTLAQLSESLQKKTELEQKVGLLKQSPQIEELRLKSEALGNDRKKLESLKNTDNSSKSGRAGGGGSFNVDGSQKTEGAAIDSDKASQEGREIDFEQLAKNFIEQIKLKILKLEKEELEYSPEGLSTKMGEVDAESKKVKIETRIWESGGMSQETFSENMKKAEQPEGEDFKNKELFLQFKEADNEVKNYKNENQGFYKTLEAKQSEIDGKESSLGADLNPLYEGAILKMLGKDGQGKETMKPEDLEELRKSDLEVPESELKKETEGEIKSSVEPVPAETLEEPVVPDVSSAGESAASPVESSETGKV